MFLLIFLSYSIFSKNIWAAKTSMPVKLFGVACSLESETLSREDLETIHAMSPEKIFPDLSSDNIKAADVQKSINQLQNMKHIPVYLGSYKKNSINRLNGILHLLKTKKSVDVDELDKIERDPQTEFHSVIKNNKAFYHCDLDDKVE